MEISRVMKYFMDRGAIVVAQLMAVHYRRSPLIQGRLEILCKMTVTISRTVSNLPCTEKYKEVKKYKEYKKYKEGYYIEPKSEEIMGSFIQATNDVPLLVPASPIKKESKKEEN